MPNLLQGAATGGSCGAGKRWGGTRQNPGASLRPRPCRKADLREDRGVSPLPLEALRRRGACARAQGILRERALRRWRTRLATARIDRQMDTYLRGAVA